MADLKLKVRGDAAIMEKIALIAVPTDSTEKPSRSLQRAKFLSLSSFALKLVGVSLARPHPAVMLALLLAMGMQIALITVMVPRKVHARLDSSHM